MAHGDALVGKWRGNWRMEWVDSTLYTTSVHGVLELVRNLMAHGDALERKWRGNWRMEWVDSTLYTTSEHGVLELVPNLMAHAQKPDFVFRLNWRVHLNRRGSQFSRLLAAELCASALVMLDTPPVEVVWEYWLPPPFVSFPFTSPPVRHRVPSHSERSILPLMPAPRLPVVDWTDAPADLNGLASFGERRNLISARVPSRFKRSLHFCLMTHRREIN